MKIFSYTRFIVTLLVCVANFISAMNPYKTELALSSLTSDNRRAYKRLFLPQNLDRFIYAGKIGNKCPQDIVPDDVALKLLKPAHKKLVYRYDNGLFSLPELQKLLTPYLEKHNLGDYTVIDIGRNWRHTHFVITLNSEQHQTLVEFIRADGRRGNNAVLWDGFDLVGEQNIAAKIMLLKILKRGDVESVTTKEHLRKIFATFSPFAQEYLDRYYDLIKKPEECPICYRGVYANQLVHPKCCNEKQGLCQNCYQTFNRCPYCSSQEYKEVDKPLLLVQPQAPQNQLLIQPQAHQNSLRDSGNCCTIQ